MAFLVQSDLWPIHLARSILEQAQLVYLWQFDLPDENAVPETYMRFLVQSITIPGIEIDHEAYSVGGLENYHLTQERRGGIVTANFVEIEGGFVDQFMRTWLDQVSPLSREVSRQGTKTESRYRSPRGIGSSKAGYVRNAAVQVINRNESVQYEFELKRLVPKKVGEYEFNYENSGIKMVPVQMLCDEVGRV